MKRKVLFILLIIFTLVIYILIFPTHAFSPSGETYNGIDVSAWQQRIDFEKVKQSNIEIVYMKASQGTSFIDPYFNENYEKAKQIGLKVGFYHYVDARTVEEAKEEAQFFVSVISGKTPDCKLAMDFESFGDLTKEQINNIANTFIKTVENLTKKKMIIYSDTYNATNIFEKELTNYPLWVAQYEVDEPTSNGNWSTWAGWQYTDIGEVYGIDGYVDKDKFTKEVLLNEKSEISMPQDIKAPINNKNDSITIQWGDTLSALAIEYNTTVAKLVELNNIQNPNLIYAGETLIVPIVGEESEYSNKKTTSNQTIYIVKKGDTLDKIARQYETTAIAIATENNIKNINLIYVGQKLIIPINQNDLNHTLYKIKWGDTLWSISKRYGVPIATIVRLNRIKNPNLIYAGNTIRI